ncbi:dipeptidase PepV [Mycoplasmatota bacterium]|nr:dipeptidase PepV [Mycoplasmatota bacterium]
MENFYESFKKYHDDFIKDLQGLLKIPSVLTEFNPDNEHPFGDGIHECLEFMMELGKRDHYTVKNVDNYAGHIEVGEGEEILGILCHLDVVPTGDGWKFDPFSATIEDGKIYARGALDDKGPTIVAYYAVKMLLDMGVKFNKKIRIILGLDEESGWRGLNHYLKKEKMPDLGFAPDASFPLIYGEKGILDGIFTGKCDGNGLYQLQFGDRTNVVPEKAVAVVDAKYKDVYETFLNELEFKGEVKDLDDGKVQLIAYGKSAHAMEPNDGLNAGFILLTFLNEQIDNEFVKFACKYLTFDSRMKKSGVDYTNDIMGDLTCNVGVCLYENNKFSLELNFRYPIHTDVENMTKVLKQKAADFNFEYSTDRDSKPHYVDPESDLVKTLHQAYIKYTNDDKSPLLTIGGGTYARNFKNAVAFGPEFPNKEALIHQPNEYADLEDLYKAVAIYAEAIYNLTR